MCIAHNPKVKLDTYLTGNTEDAKFLLEMQKMVSRRNLLALLYLGFMVKLFGMWRAGKMVNAVDVLEVSVMGNAVNLGYRVNMQ